MRILFFVSIAAMVLMLLFGNEKTAVSSLKEAIGAAGAIALLSLIHFGIQQFRKLKAWNHRRKFEDEASTLFDASQEVRDPETAAIFSKVVKEVESKAMDEPTWAKALMQAKGNQEAAHSLYLRYRITALKRDADRAKAIQTKKAEDARFGGHTKCKSCGYVGNCELKKRASDPLPVVIYIVALAALFLQILSPNSSSFFNLILGLFALFFPFFLLSYRSICPICEERVEASSLGSKNLKITLPADASPSGQSWWDRNKADAVNVVIGSGVLGALFLLFRSPTDHRAAGSVQPVNQEASIQASAPAASAKPTTPSNEVVLIPPGGALPGTGIPFRHMLRSGGEGPIMIGVPGGRFRMGSPNNEVGRREDEGPVREVSISPYAAGKFEITVAEFRRFAEATGYLTDAEANVDLPDDNIQNPGCYLHREDMILQWDPYSSWRSPGLQLAEPNFPAVCISWNDAQFYTKWLSNETKARYRLPSEAEQEWQLRGGVDGQTYGWGESLQDACRYGNVAGLEDAWDDAAPCHDGNSGLSEVGQYLAQGFGLHDVVGNALEWGQDCYAGDYSAARRLAASAMGIIGCPLEVRILRGASWSGRAPRLRSADRNPFYSAHRNHVTGFRVALDQ